MNTVAGSIQYLSQNERLNDGVAATAHLAQCVASKAMQSPTLNSAWNTSVDVASRFGPSSETMHDVTLGLIKTLSGATSKYDVASNLGTISNKGFSSLSIFSREDNAQKRETQLEEALRERVLSILKEACVSDQFEDDSRNTAVPLMEVLRSFDSKSLAHWMASILPPFNLISEI